jgi:hypothetical protein
MSREQPLKCVVPKNGGTILRVPEAEAQLLVEVKKSHKYASKMDWKRQQRVTQEGGETAGGNCNE